MTRVFSRAVSSAPRPTHGYPWGPMFSVRVVSLSWLVPVLKRQISFFVLAWLSRINVAQELCRGHACNELGSNKWHYSSFVSIHLSARCIPSRPRTAPSTPILYFYLYLFVSYEYPKCVHVFGTLCIHYFNFLACFSTFCLCNLNFAASIVVFTIILCSWLIFTDILSGNSH
jgi:hypothetical protein